MNARRTLPFILIAALAATGETCSLVVEVDPGTPQTYTSPQTVTLNAQVNTELLDYGGISVSRVEFRDGGTLKCSDATSPYRCGWAVTNADNGTHSWEATVVDSRGTTYDSIPVSLTVDIAGAAPSDPTLMGFVPTAGTARDVEVQQVSLGGELRDLAYVSSDEFGLTIFDITDPGDPQALGATIPSFKGGVDMAVEGNLAVVAAGSQGLRVVDISDPTQPTPVGSLDAEIRGVAMAGRYAYARVSVPGNPAHTDLAVVDLINPMQPSIVTQLFLASSDSVEVVGNRVYATAGGALHVFDISNPRAPQARGSVSIPGGARELAVAGTKAYVGNLSGVYVVNVSNPSQPSLMGSVSGGTFDLAVKGTHLYSVGGGCRIIDVSNPNAPYEISSADDFFSQAIEIHGGVALLASPNVDVGDDEGGLYLVDVSSASATQLLAHVPGAMGGNFGVASSGSIAVTAAGNGGLHVVDVTDPTWPVPLGWLEGNFRGVAMAGRYAYARIALPGNPAHTDLAVVDLVDPRNPRIVAQLFLPGSDGVEVVGNRVYVTTGGTLQVFDVSNPLSPQARDSVTIPNGALELAVDGNRAYVGNYSGIHVIDVTNANQLRLVGSLGGLTFDLAAADGRLYSVGGGLRIFDVANPAAPSLIQTVPDFSGMGVDVLGDLAFIASPSKSNGGVFVYDVSNPGAPELLDPIAVPGPARAVEAGADFVYVGDDTSLVNVLAPGL